MSFLDIWIKISLFPTCCFFSQHLHFKPALPGHNSCSFCSFLPRCQCVPRDGVTSSQPQPFGVEDEPWAAPPGQEGGFWRCPQQHSSSYPQISRLTWFTRGDPPPRQEPPKDPPALQIELGPAPAADNSSDDNKCKCSCSETPPSHSPRPS